MTLCAVNALARLAHSSQANLAAQIWFSSGFSRKVAALTGAGLRLLGPAQVAQQQEQSRGLSCIPRVRCEV